MFSQRLDSSEDSAWRKAAAMFLSMGLHLFVMAVAVIIPLLYVEYIVTGEGDPTSTTLAFSSHSGDPHSTGSRFDTSHAPHVQVVSTGSRRISKINALLFEPMTLPPDLAVIGPVPLIYDPGRDGWPSRPCGCVGRYIDPPHPAAQSHFTKGVLINRVDPQYPPLARQAGIHGAIVMQAVIDREGVVRNIEVISGPQQLRAAAVEAVRQWRYEPFVLDGLAVDVETTITVNFELTGRT